MSEHADQGGAHAVHLNVDGVEREELEVDVCIVGAGAAVIRDTPDGVCVVGVPASEIGVTTDSH